MIPENSDIVSRDFDTNIYQRLNFTYLNISKKFINHDRTFERQYAMAYSSRLASCIPLLKKQAKLKWGASVNIKQLSDISGNEQVVVFGTIFKLMELHPTILKEICEENNMVPQPVVEEFTQDDDYIILEDDTQRVILCGNIEPQNFVTGVNIAVSGYTEEGGKFYVKEYCHPFVISPTDYPISPSDRYVLFISGLCFNEASVTFPFQTLIDLITGNLGCSEEQEKFSKLIRVVIAGNSIGQNAKDFHKTNILTRKTKASTIESVKLMDDFLAQLVTSVDVDLMPGEFDPTNHLMPQQAFHPCMFPRSSAYSTFHAVTNPYEAIIDGVRILGTSGQNVKDIKAYSRLSDSLYIMEKTLEWGHMLPTAPDTLNCYPFVDEDPFILSEYPHVYFTGNTNKMSTKFYGNKKVLMLAVPKFVETFSCMLLNLRTLEVEPLLIGDTLL